MKILMTLFLMTSLLSIAEASTGTRGGGDLCEDRIKVIRDDLKIWVASSGPQSLKLPANLTPAQYSASMTSALDSAKIRCVGVGDSGYPVNINGTPKVCVFDKTAGGGLTCDFVKFQSMADSDQYRIVHHEYAGLAGIEIPNGDDSDYSVSNQISEYLDSSPTRTLGVMSGGISTANQSTSSRGDGDEARTLIQALKDAGVRSTKDQNGNDLFELNAYVAASRVSCENGQISYDVDLKSKENQTSALNGLNQCDGHSSAQNFADLMLRWGAQPLISVCGLGNICWPTINMWCIHKDAVNGQSEVDMCTVNMQAPE